MSRKGTEKTLFFNDPKPDAELSPQTVSLIWANYDRYGQRAVAWNYSGLNGHNT